MKLFRAFLNGGFNFHACIFLGRAKKIYPIFKLFRNCGFKVKEAVLKERFARFTGKLFCCNICFNKAVGCRHANLLRGDSSAGVFPPI